MVKNLKYYADRWPSRSELARDLGCTGPALSRMVARNAMRSKYLSPFVKAAKKRRLKITAQNLVDALETEVSEV